MQALHGGRPSGARRFYFETEGMCADENDIRRPGRGRERAEGERPGSGPEKQRWEAVFRRERRPGSLDRFSTAGGFRLPTLRGKGKTLFSARRFLPANSDESKEILL